MQPPNRKISSFNLAFFGSSKESLVVLNTLLSSGIKPTIVCASNDKPKGRGRVLSTSALRRVCFDENIRVVTPDDIPTKQFVSMLAELNINLSLVASYSRILPEAVLNAPKYKTLNIHPSLLPLYRGPSPVISSVLNGDTHSGVSLIVLEKKVDSGPIVAQSEKICIEKNEFACDLTQRLFKLGTKLFLEVVSDYLKGALPLSPQIEKNATFTKKVSKEDGFIDWNICEKRLIRLFLAYHPAPGVYTTWNKKRLLIHSLETPEAPEMPLTTDIPTKLAVGRTKLFKDLLLVGTKDRPVSIKNLQLEGKKVVSFKEFINGHPNFLGSVLPS